jgi:Ser/Thr protein kinase RdoA (MazF antagonist)
VTESSAGPALPAAERQAAEALLTEAWGERVRVRTAEPVWDRSHVVRLHLGAGHLGAGRSAVLKRRGGQEHDPRDLGFEIELAALEYLNAMPVPVAPRLLAADPEAGIMLMEDLGPGATLADSLLTGGREQAQADLIAYARALGSLHAWSAGQPGRLAELRARYAPGATTTPRWMAAIGSGQDAFLGAAAALGLPVAAAGDEIDQLGTMLDARAPLGLVHGDACPDNVRITNGSCRIFDFETSGWGPVSLDAAHLVAPFPSCWCFGRLPAEVAGPAVGAYRARLTAAGIDPGPDWDAAMAAALVCWIIVRGGIVARLLNRDPQWGTTTMRPRLLTWLRSFIEAAGRAGVLPALLALASALNEQLSVRWPHTVIPDYPALAQPGSTPAEVPDWWHPNV